MDEVLDLSRAEGEELRLVPTAVDADTLVGECLQLVAYLARARRITCHFEGSSAPTRLWCDAGRLNQILLNLLSNAVKYNREGGNVWVSVQRTEGGCLRFAVRDTGEGISPGDLARLFVPFTRLQADTAAADGVGMGLVVSRRIAEAMGGRLELESTVDVGSTCWMELPVGKDVGEEPPVVDVDADALRGLLAEFDLQDLGSST